MRHEGQQAVVDPRQFVPRDTAKSLVVGKHDPGQGDPQGHDTSDEHSDSHPARPEPGLANQRARLRRRTIRERGENRFIDPLRQTGPGKDQTRIHHDEGSARVEDFADIGRMVDTARGDQGNPAAGFLSQSGDRGLETREALGSGPEASIAGFQRLDNDPAGTFQRHRRDRPDSRASTTVSQGIRQGEFPRVSQKSSHSSEVQEGNPAVPPKSIEKRSARSDSSAPRSRRRRAVVPGIRLPPPSAGS